MKKVNKLFIYDMCDLTVELAKNEAEAKMIVGDLIDSGVDIKDFYVFDMRDAVEVIIAPRSIKFKRKN